jgi:hypothetical protein
LTFRGYRGRIVPMTQQMKEITQRNLKNYSYHHAHIELIDLTFHIWWHNEWLPYTFNTEKEAQSWAGRNILIEEDRW